MLFSSNVNMGWHQYLPSYMKSLLFFLFSFSFFTEKLEYLESTVRLSLCFSALNIFKKVDPLFV